MARGLWVWVWGGGADRDRICAKLGRRLVEKQAVPPKLPKGGLWCPAPPGIVSNLIGLHNCIVTCINPAFLCSGLRISLAAFAARARCRLTFNLMSTRSPPRQQSCSPASRPPASTGAWGCSSPVQDLRMFRFLRWSRTGSFPTMGGTLFPQSLP